MLPDDSGAGRTSDRPVVYQIRIKGHLSPQWTGWFEGLTITLEEDGSTLLAGPVVDQPALHGILKKIRNTGLPLLSVNRAGPDLQDRVDAESQPTGDS
jgi:hypothetical protein